MGLSLLRIGIAVFIFASLYGVLHYAILGKVLWSLYWFALTLINLNSMRILSRIS